MRYFLLFVIILISSHIGAQDQLLGSQYYRNGDYEKASEIFKSLFEKNPINSNYLNYFIDCYQQLERFNEVEVVINKQLISLPEQDYLYVKLGYNYQLQHQYEKALPYYEKALKSIEKSPNLGYQVGKAFQDCHLVDYALQAYTKAMEHYPFSNYNAQIAFLYGEKGEVEKMFDAYLNMVAHNPDYLNISKSYIGNFITDDAENEHNKSLLKLLLQRSQTNPIANWNLLLSWLFVQQQDFNKALIQEKALIKRNEGDIKNIVEIGKIAFENNDFTASKNCFFFILESPPNIETALTAEKYLLEIELVNSKNLSDIETKFQTLFTSYGTTRNTLEIAVLYSDFLAFKKNEINEALTILDQLILLPLTNFEKGTIKIKIADILVFTNKFGNALIHYTQVQNDLKNHAIGQLARFKIAQTSYFKGDFEWAQSQLSVLKNSTSQLIANDALDLNLLITDNATKDSLKVALKKYAIAELLAFQNKNKEAIDTLQVVLTNYKGHSIEDEALLKQAKLFEKTNQFEAAITNYLKIIQLNSKDILADDAHYFLAELYLNKLNNVLKAKEYYEKIIFDYPSSIYLVDARKKFRNLRGDLIN